MMTVKKKQTNVISPLVTLKQEWFILISTVMIMMLVQRTTVTLLMAVLMLLLIAMIGLSAQLILAILLMDANTQPFNVKTMIIVQLNGVTIKMDAFLTQHSVGMITLALMMIVTLPPDVLTLPSPVMMAMLVPLIDAALLMDVRILL
jgi:hypothetical protein